MAVRAVKVFLSYSHKDEELRVELENHLKLLERNGVITIWHDRKILPGEELNRGIHSELAAAQIVLLLVSANFMASNRCWQEMEQAMQRHAAGEACVIPVLLKPVDLQEAPFHQLKGLPTDKQPIETWSTRNAAFSNVAEGIRLVARQLAQGIPPSKVCFSSLQEISSPQSKTWHRRRLLRLMGLGSIGACAGVGSSLLAKQLLQSPNADTLLTVPDFFLSPPAQKKPPPTSGSFTFEVVTIDEQGQLIEQRQGQAQRFIEQFGDVFLLEMVLIPAGTFEMGSTLNEVGHSDAESPVHTVNILAFAIGRYPITQAQWKSVALLSPMARELNPDPSRFKGATLPVETIAWRDAVEFCQRLTRQTGRQYRLPNEAEWEYACRAGTKTPFHFGATLLSQLANFDGAYPYKFAPAGVDRRTTTPIGFFKVANAFGLSDMHGNVWEFCQDQWRKNYVGAPTDGSVRVDPLPNYNRVIRGGSWFNRPERCRAAHREWCYEGLTDVNLGLGGSNFGLRVVCSL